MVPTLIIDNTTITVIGTSNQRNIVTNSISTSAITALMSITLVIAFIFDYVLYFVVNTSVLAAIF